MGDTSINADRTPAQVQATLNEMAVSTLPNEAPSGTERCPEGRIRIGMFFDGTGNNMFLDGRQKKLSNVAKLFTLYRREGSVQTSAYHIGVGSEDTEGMISQGVENMLGGGMGLGGRARIDWGRTQITEFFNRGTNHLAVEKIFDTYGFSRGAALARDFVNNIKKFRVDDLSKQPRIQHLVMGNHVEEIKIYPPLSGLTSWFLGIFDTVGSFTVAGKDLDVEYDFNVDKDWVHWTVHFIAEDEVRSFFSLQSIKGKRFWRRLINSDSGEEPLPANMEETPYPGAHSDVGGGYGPGDQGKEPQLSHIPLRDMHAKSIAKGVPLNPLTNLAADQRVVPGDLERWYGQYLSDRPTILHGKYIQALPNDEYEAAMRAREGLGSWASLKGRYIHSQSEEFGATTFIDRPVDMVRRFEDRINPFYTAPIRQRAVYYNASRR